MKFILLLAVVLVITKQDCPPNCVQCSSSAYCTRCADGYQLSGGKCLPCTTGCATCPTFTSTCTLCFYGYQLSGGRCYPCTDPHCALCPNFTNFCTECYAGYRVLGGDCYPAALNVQSE